jgi:two-component system cell cycle response regulator
VLMFDIDHFKSVNDTEGHPGGDVVLQEFARRLQATVRADDLVGRWGGEEFIVIAPHTDLDGAMLLGERARRAIANTPFDIGDHVRGVTVSVGCAAGSTAGQQLVRAADIALYTSKSNGRNQVTPASPDL